MSRSNPKVLAAVKKTEGFSSAQEIYQLMIRTGEKIGLTTVYRSLQSLVSNKDIDVLRNDEGESIYRFCGPQHHHHLVCTKCSVTVEISGGAIEKWAKTMAERNGFTETGHSAEIYGLCKECS